MKKIFRWIGLLIAVPFILFFGVYVFTLIVQLWPEPIAETFKSACDSELGSEYTVSDRRHSYSNWMHGVWYTDHGKVKLTLNEASLVVQRLNSNSLYEHKDNGYEKDIVGKVLANCSANLNTGIIEFGLVLR